jgi:cytoskeletal protein RodZ
VSCAFPRRWPRVWPWACSCVLLLAGCGGGARKAQEPRLPRSLAREWAAQARAIAARLDAGNACRARDLALALQQRTIRDVGRVPSRFREDLQGGVNDLADRTASACANAKPPAPPPPPAPSSSSTSTSTSTTSTETQTHETTTTPSTSSTTTTSQPPPPPPTTETTTAETSTDEGDE